MDQGAGVREDVMKIAEFFDNAELIFLELAKAHAPTADFSTDDAVRHIAVASHGGRFAPWRVVLDGYVIETWWGEASCWEFLDEADSGDECVSIVRDILVDIEMIESGRFSTRLDNPRWWSPTLDVVTVGRRVRHFGKDKGAEWPVGARKG